MRGNCGDEEHSYKECRGKTKCCVLCKKVNEINKNSDAVKSNHDSRASECPKTKKVKIAVVNFIDYHG